MKNPILVPEFRDLIKRKKFKIIKSFLDDQHPKEIAEYLGFLEPDEIWKILNLVDEYIGAEIFVYLDIDVQVRMMSGAFRNNIRKLLQQMSHDDRADLFQHIDREIVNRLLLLLPPKDRADIINLTSYRKETCGAMMTTDFATLLEDDSVEVAIKKIRKDAPGKETIYYIYVTDGAGMLVGFVSLRKLILSRPKQKVRNIMKRDVIYAHVDDDQENAANMIEDYDLIALPIVDEEGKIAGIITYDDAIDIIREEQTEDMEKLMAISGGPEQESYLNVSSYTHFKKRVSWVIILAMMQFVSGFIIQGFTETLQNFIILAYYMPLLNSTGGNTGSQSATMVIRALALNELTFRDMFKVVKKELVVSLMISASVGLMVFLRVFVFTSGGGDIPAGLTVARVAYMLAAALSIQVIWATILGALVPLVATRFRIDPAVVSSPAIATLVDIGGIAIYFTTAKIILGI
jgi:magnesium transporter